MTDTLEITYIPYKTIKAAYPFYNYIPLIQNLYTKGKQPNLLELDYIIATSTTNLSALAEPTAMIAGFTPTEVWLSSTTTDDLGYDVTLLGQKGDGSFGEFDYELPADSTTMSLGTWNAIFKAYVPTTFSLTSTHSVCATSHATTYFIMGNATKVPTNGFIYVPDGYYGAVYHAELDATSLPATTTSSLQLNIGEKADLTISAGAPHQAIDMIPHAFEETEQIQIESKYAGAAVVPAAAHIGIVVWKDT